MQMVAKMLKICLNIKVQWGKDMIGTPEQITDKQGE